MKKTAYFIGGIVLYIGMALVFSSYGNILAHRNINKGIIEQFKTRFLGSTNSGEFKNYSFLFDSSVGYEGEMITKGGYLYVTEGIKSLSAEEWITEGGFSADEPELQASLRHFYDPIEDTTERYLKDHLGIIMRESSPTFNPRIDHIAWATTEAEHLYNWSIGKAKLKKALETSDNRDRNELMAYAWRSLGETLHMIADMGCPAHVRDDAHPGLFSDYSVIKHFGNSDPYENICEQLTDRMVGWCEGKVDPNLKDKFFKAHTVKEIGHELATYTNRNFFTDQTISGTNIIPRIHPEKTYPSPKLEDCIYDRETYYFTKKISGHDVFMCRDLTYALGLFERRGEPYMDRTCVESQAAALMPQIAEAGANAIRLFLPDLKIEITELTESSIKGKVIHTKDAEYINEIKYNGEIELVNSKSSGKVGVIDCEDGEFNVSMNIKKLDIDWDSVGLIARILFGGVTVNSPVSSTEVSGDFAMTIIDYDSGAILEDTVQRCKQINIQLSFPPGTDDSYYTIDYGDNTVYSDLGIRENPMSNIQNYMIPGTYKIAAKFQDKNKNIVDEVEAEIIVPRNDFLEALKSMKTVAIDMGWPTYYIFEDGKSYWAAFDYYHSLADGPEAELSWSGRSFDLHRKGEERELKISGTLSEDCWSIEYLHATIEIKNAYTSELTIKNLPVIESYMAPCPGMMPEEQSYIYFEPEQYVTSMSARKREQNKEVWYAFSSVDWSKVSLAIKFTK